MSQRTYFDFPQDKLDEETKLVGETRHPRWAISLRHHAFYPLFSSARLEVVSISSSSYSHAHGIGFVFTYQGRSIH